MQPTSVAAFLENMVKDSKRRLAIAITIVFFRIQPIVHQAQTFTFIYEFEFEYEELKICHVERWK